MVSLRKGIGLLMALLLSFITTTTHADFVGRWCWDHDNDVSAFSIVIHKAEGRYRGAYYSVVQRGNRIDDNDRAFSFKLTKKNRIRTKLIAGISGSTGLIGLKLVSDQMLEWLLLKVPKGDIYVPKMAVLHRC